MGGVSSLPDGINGVSGAGVANLCGSTLLARDPESQCLALCVRVVVLNTAVLPALGAWYWKYSEVLGSHFAFPWKSAKG